MIHRTDDGFDIYYEVAGKKDAQRTLIFLNGLTQSTVSWGFVTPVFTNDFRIVLMDAVLQGRSDKRSEWRSFDRHAQDLKGLLDELKIEKPIVVGISYGSMIAQHFAVNYPDRLEKLILLSSLAHKTPYFDAIGHAWWRALESGGYPLMLDVMLPTVLSEGYFKNPLIPLDVMKDARLQSGIDPAAVLKLMKATEMREDFRPKLSGIKVPTLILHGEKDLLLPVTFAEEIHKNLPGSGLFIIPLAGHTLNLEGVPQVVSHMKSFLGT
jgi:3-oxoadipate enol-lactonase